MGTADIKHRVEAAFPGSEVEVTDLTGTNDHFQLLVVSEKFEGLSLVEQHRLVYASLGKEMQGPIHALSLKTMTRKQREKERDLK